MTGLRAALWAEFLKARRSRLPWLTALGFALAPLVGGLFMIIVRDPEWARSSGLITAKAQITAGTADWPAYFDLLAQTISMGGLVIFGFIAIWEFGREYADRTIKDLLALPTPRGTIVVAKIVVAAVWSAALVGMVYALGLAMGSAIDLPGWSAALAVASAGRIAAIGALTFALVVPFAWAASAGRGYLPPVGMLFFVLFLSQVIAALGWGAYFPWSVPALSSGVAGREMQDVGAISYLIVIATGLLGAAATLSRWRSADQM